MVYNFVFFFCRKKGEVQIIGAISIDLNGVPDEVNLNQAVEKTRAQVIFPTIKK